MPLVEFLCSGLNLEPGWHRKQERMLRNPNKPLRSISEQLQPEEKQLILFETMLLSGTIYSSSNSSQQRINKDLAHAWGREKGFHNLLVSQMCERRGDLSRKRRSDVGKSLSDKEKATFRTKLIKTRSEKRAKFGSTSNNGDSVSNETTMQVEREQQEQHHLQLPNPIYESKPLNINNNHIQTHHTQQLSHAAESIDNGNYPSTTITRPHHFVPPGERIHDQFQLTDHHQHPQQGDPHQHQLSTNNITLADGINDSSY